MRRRRDFCPAVSVRLRRRRDFCLGDGAFVQVRNESSTECGTEQIEGWEATCESNEEMADGTADYRSVRRCVAGLARAAGCAWHVTSEVTCR